MVELGHLFSVVVTSEEKLDTLGGVKLGGEHESEGFRSIG